jgi:hypothetical protein
MSFGPSSRAIVCATACRPNVAPENAAWPEPPRSDAVAPVQDPSPACRCRSDAARVSVA